MFVTIAQSKLGAAAVIALTAILMVGCGQAGPPAATSAAPTATPNAVPTVLASESLSATVAPSASVGAVPCLTSELASALDHQRTDFFADPPGHDEADALEALDLSQHQDPSAEEARDVLVEALRESDPDLGQLLFSVGHFRATVALSVC